MRFGLLTFLFTMMVSTISMACQCIPVDEMTAEKSYIDADVIVSAQVLLVSKGWGSSGPLATISIQKIIKGEAMGSDTVVIQYNPSVGACGTPYAEGETYVIGLYDIKNMNSTKARVGDYRAMDACSQSAIEYYLNNLEEEK